MSIISKELLSEVLQQNVISVYEQRNQHRYTTSSVNGPWTSGSDVPLPNMYELAHKCKEWAWEKHSLMLFQTQYFPKVYYGIKDLKTPMEDFISKVPQCDRFSADTEPEAIFKACEYILKEHK